jgi:hypothetical protein
MPRYAERPVEEEDPGKDNWPRLTGRAQADSLQCGHVIFTKEMRKGWYRCGIDSEGNTVWSGRQMGAYKTPIELKGRTGWVDLYPLHPAARFFLVVDDHVRAGSNL